MPWTIVVVLHWRMMKTSKLYLHDDPFRGPAKIVEAAYDSVVENALSESANHVVKRDNYIITGHESSQNYHRGARHTFIFIVTMKSIVSIK